MNKETLVIAVKKINRFYMGYLVCKHNGKYLWSKKSEIVRTNRNHAMLDAQCMYSDYKN